MRCGFDCGVILGVCWGIGLRGWFSGLRFLVILMGLGFGFWIGGLRFWVWICLVNCLGLCCWDWWVGLRTLGFGLGFVLGMISAWILWMF